MVSNGIRGLKIGKPVPRSEKSGAEYCAIQNQFGVFGKKLKRRTPARRKNMGIHLECLGMKRASCHRWA
jgi:hypothetical protein